MPPILSFALMHHRLFLMHCLDLVARAIFMRKLGIPP